MPNSPYGHPSSGDLVLFSTTLTATTNGTGFDSLAGVVRLTLNVTAASGTTPTLDVKIQTRMDSTDTWRDLPANGSFAQKTTTGSERKCFAAIDREVRAVATIGGTTPSFTFSVSGEAA